jgi:hypothetical protein
MDNVVAGVLHIVQATPHHFSACRAGLLQATVVCNMFIDLDECCAVVLCRLGLWMWPS